MDKDTENKPIKASDYLALYGILYNRSDLQTGINGNPISVKDFFDNYPDFILNDAYIDIFDSFDSLSFCEALKYFDNETELITYIRDIFDNYRTNGGDPLKWLYRTFETFMLNPHNYPAQFRGAIHRELTSWIDSFQKLDYEILEPTSYHLRDILTPDQWSKLLDWLVNTVKTCNLDGTSKDKKKKDWFIGLVLNDLVNKNYLAKKPTHEAVIKILYETFGIEAKLKYSQQNSKKALSFSLPVYQKE